MLSPQIICAYSELKNTEKMEDIDRKLCNAVWKGDVDSVQDYLQKGADVNYSADDGWTPLHWAAWRGNTDMKKVLLEEGAPLSVVNNDVSKPSVKLR